MEKGNLRVKFSHGEIMIELKGDSTTVLNELRSLKKDGTGKLMEFFRMVSTLPSAGIQSPQVGTATTLKAHHLDIKGFPPLNDIVLKNLPKSESEWIAIYGYFASNMGKKTFTRDELWGQYKTSGRDTKGRNNNLTNNIKQAVSNGWLSNITEDTFSFLEDGIIKAKEIASREKAAKKRSVRPRVKKNTKEGKA